MTLRLRLTLFYTLLVAVILVGSGITLHILFQRSLQASFDQAMRETNQILLSTFEEEGFEYENGELELHIDPRSFPNEQTALIFDTNGELVADLGGRIQNINQLLDSLTPGFYSNGSTRILVEAVDDFSIVLLRNTNSINQTLAQFDRLFLILIPVALLISFGLGFLLARQALNPVDRLTKAAYDLANRRAWQEKLPEPRTKDELWRLSSATNTLLASLKDVIETEKRFTADAAHELRTPITILQGRLEQALEHTSNSQNRSRLLKAHAATENLLELVKKLLLLARTEAGQGLSKEQIALDEVAFHTAENIKSLFDEKGLSLVLDLPEDPAYVQGDNMALELLTRNLLENALKFTETGCVKLRVKQGNQNVTLSVQDSGSGIPEESLGKLFERFYQTDVRHRQHGSGLGLSLVKSIADWHGAKLSVENNNDRGTLFSVVFTETPLNT